MTMKYNENNPWVLRRDEGKRKMRCDCIKINKFEKIIMNENKNMKQYQKNKERKTHGSNMKSENKWRKIQDHVLKKRLKEEKIWKNRMKRKNTRQRVEERITKKKQNEKKYKTTCEEKIERRKNMEELDEKKRYKTTCWRKDKKNNEKKDKTMCWTPSPNKNPRGTEWKEKPEDHILKKEKKRTKWKGRNTRPCFRRIAIKKRRKIKEKAKTLSIGFR